MTIEERIESAKQEYPDGFTNRSFPETYVFVNRDDLDGFIQQVRKQQREQFEVAIEHATGSTELIKTIYNIMPELKED